MKEKSGLSRRGFLTHVAEGVTGGGLAVGLGIGGSLLTGCDEDSSTPLDESSDKAKASQIPLASLPPHAITGSNAANRRDTDYFPFFSDEEFAARYAKIQAEMVTAGYKALIVYGGLHYSGNDTGQANVVYLANFAFLTQSYVILPQSGEPTLYAPYDFHVPPAKKVSPIQNVVYSPDLTAGPIMTLNALGLAQGDSIGIVAYTNASIPYNHYKAFEMGIQPVGGVMLKEATAWFENLRWKHSVEELAALERAGKITDLVVNKVYSAAKPGVKHIDLHRVLQVSTATEGGTFALSHVGSTPMENPTVTYPDMYPTTDELKNGDVFMTEIAVGYGNYTTKICSTAFVGEPSDDYKRLFELAVKILHSCTSTLKPGMTGKDVNQFLVNNVTGDYTYYQPLLMGWSTYLHSPWCGGIPGTIIHTYLTMYTEAFVFEPGHTFSIIPWVGIKDTNKAVWLGTTYKFTDDGLEPFTSYPVDEMRIIKV